MTVELGEFPSKGTPGKYYTVKRGSDDVIYCDCWAWKKNRTCSHKKAVEFQLSNAGSSARVYDNKEGGVSTTRKMTIQEAIDRAVAEMKGVSC